MIEISWDHPEYMKLNDILYILLIKMPSHFENRTEALFHIFINPKTSFSWENGSLICKNDLSNMTDKQDVEIVKNSLCIVPDLNSKMISEVPTFSMNCNLAKLPDDAKPPELIGDYPIPKKYIENVYKLASKKSKNYFCNSK